MPSSAKIAPVTIKLISQNMDRHHAWRLEFVDDYYCIIIIVIDNFEEKPPEWFVWWA